MKLVTPKNELQWRLYAFLRAQRNDEGLTQDREKATDGKFL